MVFHSLKSVTNDSHLDKTEGIRHQMLIKLAFTIGHHEIVYSRQCCHWI